MVWSESDLSRQSRPAAPHRADTRSLDAECLVSWPDGRKKEFAVTRCFCTIAVLTTVFTSCAERSGERKPEMDASAPVATSATIRPTLQERPDSAMRPEPGTAERINEHARRSYQSTVGTQSYLGSDRYLVQLIVQDSSGAAAPQTRYLLYRADATEVELLDSTKALSVGTVPKFFETEGATLVVSEGEVMPQVFGLLILRVQRDSLEVLPSLNVGVPDEESETGANSVFQHLTIEAADADLVFKISSDLLQNPTTAKKFVSATSMLCRDAGSAIVFVLRDSTWELRAGRSTGSAELDACKK
jgi:hypothetical protein